MSAAPYLVWNAPSGSIYDSDRLCCGDCGWRLGGGETAYRHPADKLVCSDCHATRVLAQRAIEERQDELADEHDTWADQHAGCAGCWECEPEAAEGLS